MTVKLERVDPAAVPWTELDRRPSRVICQTKAWLDFLVETQGVEPVAARVVRDGEGVGWFSGAIMRRYGLKILGSPMRGWTTATMGFDLDEGTSVSDAMAALPAFAFRQLGCVHLEVADRNLIDEAEIPEGYAWSWLEGYELDIDVDDAALKAGMKRDARYNIGLAGRKGITIEVVDPANPGDFSAVYYDQVSEAFAKRSLVPTYPLSRVEAMVRHLGPTGNLLLLRARTAEGDDAATGIFPGQPGGDAEYWMGGSYRAQQALKPNELLMWTALTTWRDRGAVRMNFGGGGLYKAKYGGATHRMPWLRRSRFTAMERARDLAYQQYRRRRSRMRKQGEAQAGADG